MLRKRLLFNVNLHRVGCTIQQFYIIILTSVVVHYNQFSFEDCNFNIQRSKENTARVVVWLMGVENSYTMEASFCGSSLGSRANTHLTIKDFEDIGQTFCETLLDYYKEDPRNVRYYLLLELYTYCQPICYFV